LHLLKEYKRLTGKRRQRPKLRAAATADASSDDAQSQPPPGPLRRGRPRAAADSGAGAHGFARRESPPPRTPPSLPLSPHARSLSPPHSPFHAPPSAHERLSPVPPLALNSLRTFDFTLPGRLAPLEEAASPSSHDPAQRNRRASSRRASLVGTPPPGVRRPVSPPLAAGAKRPASPAK
jgi:hypothetical protein